MSQNDLILLNQLLGQQMKTHGEGLTESDYFEIFAAEQVLKDEDLSYEEIQSGIVGNSGDGGIDGFYFFINGALYNEDFDLNVLKKNIELQIVIIQAKTSSGFSEDGVDKFISVTRDLFNLGAKLSSFKKVYHLDLLDKVGKFRKVFLDLAASFPKLTFRYAYVAKASDEEHPNVARKRTALEETLRRHFSSVNFVFDFLGASELLMLARRAPAITYKLALAETPISTGQEGFVCLVRLNDFFEFINDGTGHIREHLFEGNVRDYQGHVEVNREIRATLKASSEEDFWWLNNGISMLCKNASLTGKILTIEEPEIVNGLQTSREIFEVFSKDSLPGEKRNVLVRILKPFSEVSRDRIIKATNSQTVIPPASLRATDKIHRDIEDFLLPHGLYYDRRKNHYKNLGRPVKKIVGILYAAQSVIACALQEPSNARARPSTLIKNDDTYGRIFSTDYPLELYLKCITITRSVEGFLKSSSAPIYKEHSNNLRFHVAALAALRLSGIPNPRMHEIAALNIEMLTPSFIEKAAEDIFKEYMRLGGNDQVAKGPELPTRMSKKHKRETLKLFKKSRP